MALTVSSITAEFMKDTKTIGKQAAYLDFDFGGRIHHTETLKKAGKSATWEHPVQLTGAGVNMKIIAKATKALGKDNILGEAEINVVKAVGQGMQTVTLHEPHSRELGGRVSFIISGGSQAISGLPHTEGMGSEAAGMIPGHSHEPTGAGGLGGQQEAGLGQQSGQDHGGYGREALAGAGAGAGAAGLGGAALHHHPGEQDHSYNTGRPLEGSGGQNMTRTHTQGGGGGVGGTGMFPGSNPSNVAENQGAPCDHCRGTGSVEQKMQQGLNLGGNTSGSGTAHLR